MIGHNRLRSASRSIQGPLVRPLLAFTTALVLWPGAGVAQAEDLTDDQKVFYYMGIAIERNLRSYTLSDEEFDLVIRGLREAHEGRQLEFERATYHPKVQALRRQRLKIAAHAFLADAAQREGAIRTESGLVYIEIISGSGNPPQPSATVKVHFQGTLSDGTVFDSSAQRGGPFEFQLDAVIPCWSEGIGMMKAGGKSLIICPPEIAYGERGAPRIPENAALSFEIELIEVK